MQDFRDLKVWQKAHEMVLAVYRASAGLPRTETYGLTSQLRRAAVSIPANLAEGRCRTSDPDFGRFVSIALGSAGETDYLLLLAHDLGFIDAARYKDLHDQVDEIKKMLSSLHARLRASD